MLLFQNCFRSTMLLPAAALFLAACASEPREPAPVTYRTPVSPSPTARPQTRISESAPRAAPSPVPSGQADSRGVVYYDGYESIRARRGDSIDSMAARVGLSGAELAAYNGLSTQYTPREGDELVLPATPGRYQGVRVASADQAGDVTREYEPSVPARRPSDSAEDGGWSAERTRAAIGDDRARSGVKAAPLTPPETKAPAAAERPEPETRTAAAKRPEPEAKPEPAPAKTETAAKTGATGPGGFARPVEAKVSRPYSRASGPGRNDGVDFATAAGDPVRAAKSGVVALISESLGGLGTIILIRHDNDYLTVYGRVEDVTVAKGDQVKQGQVIAKVADLAPPQGPSLHYEVRRGAESIDPTPYL